MHTDVPAPTLAMLDKAEDCQDLPFRSCFFSRLGGQVVLSVDIAWSAGTYHGLVLDGVTKQQAGTVEFVVSNPIPG